MVSEIKIRLYETQGRHQINLPVVFVKDSTFPFKPGETLTAKIQDGKVVLEKDENQQQS